MEATFSQTVSDSLRIDSPSTNISKRMGADTGVIIQAPVVTEEKKAEDTTAKKPKRHSPTKAAVFSAVLPGLGQGYNKKYWKIPIVYAGFAGLGYAVYYTATEFKGYRNAYRLQVDKDPATLGEYRGIDDAATLKSYRDYFKRNLDISAICMAVWYTLNIVDATVDAHLFEWNMKDDLNISWNPVFLNPLPGANTACLGVGIRVTM
ncbi:MAG: hypothetical protein KIS94_04195 [Chitinophagales bacterium]|nr:hypothetical protein [Chitinophagales bacterium]